MVLGHVSMAQPTMAQSAVALPATNYRAQQLYFKRMIYGQDRQCGTACDGTACNVAQPAMAESAMWVRPEGAEDAGAPGQLSLAVETGSLAFIASAADC